MARTALAIIKTHPLVGVGLNNYSLVSSQYSTAVFGKQYLAHNAYLLIAAETGLVGLAAFLSFLATLLVQAWRIIVRAPNDIVWVTSVGVFSAFHCFCSIWRGGLCYTQQSASYCAILAARGIVCRFNQED